MTVPAIEAVPRLRVGAVFIQDREAPAEWTARLREFSPVSDELGWLELVWEPGDPWAPVQRWTLYEMLHPSVVDPYELRELRGPHPRSEGHICTELPTHEWLVSPPTGYRPCLCRHKTEAWRGGPCLMVTLTQYKLFQRTGYVGRPFWTIQGARGGHKHSFTHEESLLLEREGYPCIAPGPGALEYAPFDERVVKQITRFNRLWQFRNNIDEYRQAMGPDYAKYRSDVEKELRRQLVDHLKEQMQDVYELFVRAADNGEMDDQPRTDVDFDRLEPLSEAHYIETGNILHHSALR